MNIQAQLCGIGIIILIMAFYFGSEKIGLLTEQVFTRVLIVAAFSLTLDIFSVIAIVNEGTGVFSHGFVAIICKLYLVTILLVGYAGFDYMLTDTFKEKIYNKVSWIFRAVLLVETVVIMVSPVKWFFEERIVFSYGVAAWETYIFTLIFIAATTMMMFSKEAKINIRRRYAIAIWMFVWVAAGIIQFKFKEFLLVGFAISVGILTIFFMLENPETMRDRRYGCFNSHALLLYLQQCYERHARISVVGFCLDESAGGNTSYENRKEALKRIVVFLSKNKEYKKFKKFKNVGGEIILITDSHQSTKKVLDDLKEEFPSICEKYYNDRHKDFPSLSVIVMDDCNRVRGPEDLFGLHNSLKAQLPINSGLQFVYVEEKDIEDHNRKNDMVGEIKEALEDDRVEVFYQPIYSNVTHKFVSCEALARIRRKDGSLVSPGEFIPVAEKTGLIEQIGERVFVKTCEFLRDSDIIEQGIEYVEINLSVSQVEQPNLADRFIEIMRTYSINPQWINLEITESASIQARSNLLSNMEKLMKCGVRFSLDDFGKGQSNLMYVVEMPVSIVKLDMDIVKAYFKENKAKSVLSGTVKMAHDMGLKVVAEGVEEKHELEAMQSENIDYIQGFYFSKPVEKLIFRGLLSS